MFSATWATGEDDFADEVMVDVSALAEGHSNQVKVRRAYVTATTGLGVKLEFDHTTDELILLYPAGTEGLQQYDFVHEALGEGLVSQSTGDTGDITVTTSCATGDDELYVYIEWYAN